MLPAFNQLGENAVAHDLALGLLLTWLPILMLMTIIDRNPSDNDDPLWKLNEIIDDARSCLANQDYRQQLCDSCGADPDEFDNLVYTPSRHDKGLFVNFAGQGRKRWFFGVAHNIIAGIEDNLVADYGRGWLNDKLQARACLLRPFKVHSLAWVSWRALWQVIVAIIIVCGTVGSAFIISYFTPTVGMGCRTGSYMIFAVLALFLLLVEMGSWRWTHTHPRGKVWLSRGLLVIEVTNAIWVVWIALAQVTGAYRTCACQSSTWGYGGGYINLHTTRHNPAPQTTIYWLAGTSTTCFILVCSIFFIVQQWCEQSHISTLDYKKATQGLKVCRAFRRWTHWLRSGPEQLLHLVHLLGTKVFGGSPRRVRAVRMHHPRQRQRRLPERPKTPHGSVSQEKGARVSVIEGSQVDLAGEGA